MRRILVYEYLSAGGPAGSEAEAAALLPAGVSMRNAVVQDLLRVPGVAPTCAVCAWPGAGPPGARPGASPTRPGALPATVAAHPQESAVDFVRRVARGHDRVWVIAPETGGLLARLHEAVAEAVGEARWIGCGAQAIRVASSKRATLAALAAGGVPTPLDLGPDPPGRWVVKPDDGAGTSDTRVHAHRDAAQADLRRRERAGRGAILEPFVEGEALSVSMLVGAGAAEPVAFNRQRIGIGTDGLLADLGVQPGAIDARRDPRAPRLRALAHDVARALPGLRGFVGFDLVWHAARGPVVIEVNPRVTCAYVGLSGILGRNLAGEILALHDGSLPALPETSRA